MAKLSVSRSPGFDTGSSSFPISIAQKGSSSLWIGTTELAILAGIDDRNGYQAAMNCLNGKSWRGVVLIVRTIDGAGGQGGKALQVYTQSLPPDLRAEWSRLNQGALASPTAVPLHLPAPSRIDPDIAKRIAERQWKMAIIAPALVFEKGTKGRAKTLSDIAARSHRDINGKRVTYSIDTLRGWCALVDSENHGHLARQRRSDTGKQRNLINRNWDKACPLEQAEKSRIATEIDIYIKSLWKEGASGERKIASLASTKLHELSKASGWQHATLDQCTIGLYEVRRNSSLRLSAIKNKDAKKWFNNYIPRIHRSRNELKPMDIVIGDVHPIDIYEFRDDGSIAARRMIAWLDLATNDIFYSLVLLPKGKGITQAHIVSSFVDMVSAWGLPRWLYFDNGKEYEGRELIDGFNALQGLVEGFHAFMANADEIDAALSMDESPTPSAPPPITRARPYNAPAKAIEGMFAALERFFSMIPGHIGGDRMRKKSANVGKEPKPFPGTTAELTNAIDEAVSFYRNEPQGGTMDGKSVNQRKQEAITAGWRPVTVHRSVMIFAFAGIRRVRVNTGGIELDGIPFMHDCLVPIIGEMIEVRYASWDGEFALWVDPEGRPTLIGKAPYFHPMDRSGAREQGRLVGLQNAAMRALTDKVPKIDLVAEVARHNAALPPPPEMPIGTEITLSGDAGRLVNVIHERLENPPTPTQPLYAPKSLVDQIVAENSDLETTMAKASDNAPAIDVLETFLDRLLTDQDKETAE